MNNNVAVVILNYIQYINVKPGLDELIKRGINVDIFVPDTDASDGFKEMFDNTLELLKENGYKVYRKVNKKEYKVLLEPYPCLDIKATYKIRYRYGTISAKPNLVYYPYNYLKYDCIMCSGKYDSNYLKAFSNTALVGNLKYINFKRIKHNHEKKVLLYLPTYGNVSSIDMIIDQLDDLRKDYYVIAKVHHGTTFLKEEKKRIELLKNKVDEFYDCFKDLSELMSFADVVLTDNSGSIFESLFLKIPVAVFCEDINANRLENFNTTQYELYKKGILPYTNDKNELKKTIKMAYSNNVLKKQKKWADDNLHYLSNPQKEFADLVVGYLNDKIDYRYYNFHKVFSNDYYKLLNERDSLNKKVSDYYYNEIELNGKIQQLTADLNGIKEENNILKDKLHVYENGKLYIICRNFYSVINRIRRKP